MDHKFNKAYGEAYLNYISMTGIIRTSEHHGHHEIIYYSKLARDCIQFKLDFNYRHAEMLKYEYFLLY